MKRLKIFVRFLIDTQFLSKENIRVTLQTLQSLVYSCEKFSLKKYLFLHRFSLISFYFRLFLRATEKRILLHINIYCYICRNGFVIEQ